MQALSDMQRSRSHQNPLEAIALFVLFCIYSALASIYPVLPPLLGVLFFYFVKYFESNRLSSFLYILAFLVVYEANYGYLTLSLLVYFLLLYYLLVPTLKKVLKCKICITLIDVVFVYIGFWLYTLVLNTVFWLPMPKIDWYIVFYIVVEFLVISLL